VAQRPNELWVADFTYVATWDPSRLPWKKESGVTSC
jgi:transposase InsO family protein